MILDLPEWVKVTPHFSFSPKSGYCKIISNHEGDSYFFNWMQDCKAPFSFDPYIYFLPFDKWDVSSENLGDLMRGIEPLSVKKTEKKIFGLLEPIELRLNLLLQTYSHEVKGSYPSLNDVLLKIPEFNQGERNTRKIIEAYESYDGNIDRAVRLLKVDKKDVEKIWNCFGLSQGR